MKRKTFVPAAAAIMLALTGLFLTAGCATVNSGKASAFSTGVTAARAQTKSAFDTVIELTRTNSIERILTQPTLSEAALEQVPDSAALAAWDSAFDSIEAYAGHLSTLGSPEAAQGVEDSLGTLAKQFKATSKKLGDTRSFSPKATAVFSEAASALLRAHAQKQAQAMAAQTDPAIRSVFVALADDVGADENSGLRSTTRKNWNQRLADLRVKFLDLQTPDDRRRVAKDFLDLLKRRDEQDELLAALRRTYLSLADAHAALAQGDAASLSGAIAFVSTELKHTRDVQDRLTRTLAN